MENRSDLLRRRIALHRRCLSEGVDVELARHYIRQIIEDENELARIEGDSERRE